MAKKMTLKELNSDVQRLTEVMEKNYVDLQTQLKHLEVDNLQRFLRMDQSIMSTKAGLAKIDAAIDAKEKEFPASSFVVINDSLNTKLPQHQSSQKPTFQVRSIKLDFPRFDGNNVVGWIFKALQFF